ncbi:hypothetical protein SUGI_1411760 [Cryptomeria japonica]|nr:hypothetical protein SUGI_1411760 [Cryptomeria japonica]
MVGADNVFHFFEVFAGHGSSQVALHYKERVHEALAEEIRLSDPVTATEWESMIKACFIRKCHSQKTKEIEIAPKENESARITRPPMDLSLLFPRCNNDHWLVIIGCQEEGQ